MMSWVVLFIGLASFNVPAAESCGVQGDVFTSASGRKIYLNFAEHADGEVTEQISHDVAAGGTPTELKEHASQMNLKAGQEVRDQASKFSELIKKKKIKWIGAEATPEDYAGGKTSDMYLLSRYSTLQTHFAKSGLEGEDISRATALFMGVSDFTLFKSQGTKVIIKPLESKESKEADLLNIRQGVKMMSIARSAPPDGEEGRRYHAILDKMKNALDHDDRRAFLETKAEIDSLRDTSAASTLRLVYEKGLSNMETLNARNRVMVSSALSQEGDGVINLGSAHRRGVIEELNRSCGASKGFGKSNATGASESSK